MAPLKTIVAEQLKKLGASQKDIAEKAGLNSAYLSEILSGKKLSVQRRFIEKLALALQIEPDDLYAKAGRAKKKPIASPTSASTRRTIIRANSPETEALFSNELRAFQLDPDFDPIKHVPLFIESFPDDFRVRIKEAGEVARFRPFVWPEFLGPSKGCYAITADAVGAEALFASSIFLVAPGRSIKSGSVFVGQFTYSPGSASLRAYRILDATKREFVLTGINGGSKRSVPRQVIKRFHKVVGLFEQPE